MKIVCWFSAGVTSAIATKMMIEEYGSSSVDVVFFETGDHHPDNERFISDCEKWFNHSVIILQHSDHDSIYSVFKKRQFIMSPYGAPCTLVLKKKMREQYEKNNHFTHQVFGFEYEPKEMRRAERFIREYPHTNAFFPLIEAQITKEDALKVLEKNNIEPPVMYQLGYANNNCVGCVKGGMGYWNKIRIDFPHVFEKMAKLEREIGATCLRANNERLFLDELDPNRGRMTLPYVESCGIFCEATHEGMEELNDQDSKD